MNDKLMIAELPQRKSHRLPDQYYNAPGAYFISICAHQRQCLFGRINHGVMRPSLIGQTVERIWRQQPEHFPWLRLDAHVVMPNHFHAVFWLLPFRGAQDTARPDNAIDLPHTQFMVRQFKSFATREVNLMRRQPGQPLWQRGYYDHVIRDEDGLKRLREYVLVNPARWALDRENPACLAWDEVDLWLAQQQSEYCSDPTEI